MAKKVYLVYRIDPNVPHIPGVDCLESLEGATIMRVTKTKKRAERWCETIAKSLHPKFGIGWQEWEIDE